MLCIPLVALLWVAVTGYDLRHQLLRLLDAAAGIDAVYYVVTRPLAGHSFTLSDPGFGLPSLALVLLILHFAPRPIGPARYAVLVAWALLEPAIFWTLPRTVTIPPPWYPATPQIEWIALCITAVGLLTGPVLGLVTRSWRVGTAAGAAALVISLARWHTPTASTITGVVKVQSWGMYAYLAALAAILLWWLRAEHLRAIPEWACPACRYDLRGTAPAAPCPECGRVVPDPTSLSAGRSPSSPITPPGSCS